MSELIDLTGKKFGRLTVIGKSEVKTGMAIYWDCICDCGKPKTVMGRHLRDGNIRSCGCLKSETTKARSLKHGGSGDRLYNTWQHMRSRCNNPKNKDWALYGGKGIKVCPEWDESFENFRDWALKNGYSPEKSIDRINGNGAYCPINCRWASAKQQANNTARNHIINYAGRQITLSEAAELSNVNYGTIKHRILNGWPVELAIEMPPMRKRRKMTFP